VIAACDKDYNGPMCINQLIRPKIEIPKWMRGEGIGDCTKCKPCFKNLECKHYTPVGLIKIGPIAENT